MNKIINNKKISNSTKTNNKKMILMMKIFNNKITLSIIINKIIKLNILLQNIKSINCLGKKMFIIKKYITSMKHNFIFYSNCKRCNSMAMIFESNLSGISKNRN
jgi:hypothetical protein